MYILIEENKDSRREIALIKKSLKQYKDVMTNEQKQSALADIEHLKKCIKANEAHMQKWGE